nr:MAG TPA: hypothetical protein [Caudoviricetes sp.]
MSLKLSPYVVKTISTERKNCIGGEKKRVAYVVKLKSL